MGSVSVPSLHEEQGGVPYPGFVRRVVELWFVLPSPALAFSSPQPVVMLPFWHRRRWRPSPAHVEAPVVAPLPVDAVALLFGVLLLYWQRAVSQSPVFVPVSSEQRVHPKSLAVKIYKVLRECLPVPSSLRQPLEPYLLWP